ncbi:MAG: hypothetical protein M0010_00310 [Actinomycetota bacterium]|nr:hypothetical protein [Actinomycetota bacterium]
MSAFDRDGAKVAPLIAAELGWSVSQAAKDGSRLHTQVGTDLEQARIPAPAGRGL